MRLIVTSQLDTAGANVYDDLARNFGFVEDGVFEGKPVYKKGGVWLISTAKAQVLANHLDNFFSPEYYVFASRHRSESGEKTLTVHVTGNLTAQAAVGGRPEELAFCNPCAMKVALEELHRANIESGLNYKVSMEATHHGPTELRRPVLFVEVGSSEEEWKNKDAVRAVSMASMKAAQNQTEFPKAIGIGGGHYAPLHTKTVLEGELSIGHIIPTYAIMELKKEILLEAVKKTGAQFGFLDWKGMKSEHRARIASMAGEIGLELKRGRDLVEEPGLPEYEIEEEFFREAEKIGGDKIEAVVSALGGIIKKGKDGRLQNKFMAESDIREGVIKACVDVLKERYRVETDGTKLILKEEKFDPVKAREQGVASGPLFGELAKGKAVEVNGKTIRPDMVTKGKTKIIPIKDKEIFKYI